MSVSPHHVVWLPYKFIRMSTEPTDWAIVRSNSEELILYQNSYMYKIINT